MEASALGWSKLNLSDDEAEGDEEDEDQEEDYPTLSEVDQPSQLSITTIELFEDTSKGATLRTRNVPATQKQRPTVTTRGAKSLRYKSAVSLTTVVHGFLDKDAVPRVPATLIVLSYRLNGLKRGKTNYAGVYTELEFANTNATAPALQPFVRAFAPFETPGFDQETWREEQVKTSKKITGLNVDTGFGGGGIEGDLGSERDRTERKRFFQLLQASYSSAKDGMNGYDTVWWSLGQNEDTREGVPPTFSTAMLVQRWDETSEFKGKFFMALETGKWTEMKNRIDRWFGVSKDDPILFDPMEEDRGCPKGVDSNKLGELMENEGLAGLGGYKNLKNFSKKSA
jgi:hypothetical protein